MVKYAFGFPVVAIVSHIPVKSRMAVNYVISLTCMGAHFPLNKVATPHHAKNNKNQNSYQSALLPYLLT